MSTLEELIRYCNEDHHLGALLLTGEWGCGKTYLIEQELAEALRATHFIVRVSLLGVDSVEALNEAIRQQWLLICTPFLGKLKQEHERLKKGSGFFEALSNVLLSINPFSGGIASAIVAVDPLEYIPLEPVVEDFHNKGETKKVILVFDDISRSRLDLHNLIGTINEYCENKGFTTIVVAEQEFVKAALNLDIMVYKMIKEKTIARTVRYIPNYRDIIHHIITNSTWPDQEYADFLCENEQTIYNAFVPDSQDQADSISRFHNFRSLTCALQEFHRLYAVLTEHQVPDVDRYLYSFIAYIVVSKNGITKNGKLSFEFGDEDIKALYPDYAPEMLPTSIRQWLGFSLWDEDEISKDISSRVGEKEQEKTEEN